ncbi:MAG: hypothetical protein ABSG65_04375 [Bryobacteraceae bacterium]
MSPAACPAPTFGASRWGVVIAPGGGCAGTMVGKRGRFRAHDGPRPLAAHDRPAGQCLIGESPFALPSRIDGTVRARAKAVWPINRRQMSDRMDFEIVCPNDHNQTVTFSREGFEEALKTGALVFHCNTCDTDWPPSHEDIAKIRKHLSKDSS